MPKYHALDVSAVESPKAAAVRRHLRRRIVGQNEAIDAIVELIEKKESNLYDHSRPIGSALFLGPTGTGKTRMIEALCEAVGLNENSCIKIDCAEFQHSHEIAKLIGSPPGYLGHKETPARLTQASIELSRSQEYDFTVVFFDEIEKASDSLWHLLLGVLDKGKITLGDNTQTDFSRCIIVMTSNAGSGEMDIALSGGKTGFNINQGDQPLVAESELATIGVNAAKRKFTPEFINRLDKIVAFHTLTKEQVSAVCDMELERLQTTIFTKTNPILMFKVSPAAKRQLIEDGYDPKYNGRNIRRAVEKTLGLPMARLIAAKTLPPTSTVIVDHRRGAYAFGYLEAQ